MYRPCICGLHAVTLQDTFMIPAYRWFSWGMASLQEGKSQGLYLVQLCAKYRLVSTTLTISAESQQA